MHFFLFLVAGMSEGLHTVFKPLSTQEDACRLQTADKMQ